MVLNGEPLGFEADMGCSFAIINHKTFQEKVKNAPKLRKSHLILRTYSRQKIKVLGKTNVKANYKMQDKTLPIVVKGSGPNLLGRG